MNIPDKKTPLNILFECVESQMGHKISEWIGMTYGDDEQDSRYRGWLRAFASVQICAWEENEEGRTVDFYVSVKPTNYWWSVLEK